MQNCITINNRQSITGSIYKINTEKVTSYQVYDQIKKLKLVLSLT